MSTARRRKQGWERSMRLRVRPSPDAEPAFDAAELVIVDGYCTEAAPVIGYCLDCSLPWIKGHLIYQGWTARILADPVAADPVAANPQQMSLLLA